MAGQGDLAEVFDHVGSVRKIRRQNAGEKRRPEGGSGGLKPKPKFYPIWGMKGSHGKRFLALFTGFASCCRFGGCDA